MAIEKILVVSSSSFFYPERNITFLKNSQSLPQTLFDLIIVEDLDLLKLLRSHSPKTPIVVVTPMGSIEEAVTAIHCGASDYIGRPLSPEILDTIIQKAGQPSPLLLNSRGKTEKILAESSVMQQVLNDIVTVSRSNAAVFISGESGTGKEVVAHAIHYQSPRGKQPFIKVNCAAIPETLIESEFFGHEKGSFTGAHDKRIGRFELAHGGTLLLDEISEIPLAVQAKLLRVVQEQEFERVGGNKPIRVDVRLIATSNRNMKEMIEQKLFREDLYFRLNVVPLFLPPLRERKEDILALADYFLGRFSEENQKRKKQLTPAAQKRLLDYPWPGNIRELANIMERAVVMHPPDLIDADHLRLDPAAPSFIPLPITKEITLADLEKQHILETLVTYQHNRTQAAKALGISVRTLRNKLKLYFPHS